MKRVLAAILALAMICALTACNVTMKRKPLKIGIAVPSKDLGDDAATVNYAQQICDKNETEYMTVTASSGEEMVAALKSLEEWGATAILCGNLWEEADVVLRGLFDEGIRVVTLASGEFAGSCSLEKDLFRGGYLCAEAILERIEQGGSIAIMDVPTSGLPGELYKQGFYTCLLEKKFDISCVLEMQLDTPTSDAGRTAMTDILADHPDVQAVFAFYDDVAAVSAQTIWEEAVNAAMLLWEGADVRKNIVVSPVLVDAGNVSAFLNP